MSRPDELSERLAAVLDETWTRDGLLVECRAFRPTPAEPIHTATLRQTRVPAYLEHLASSRLDVIAAAPPAVRLALELRRALVEQLGPSILTKSLKRDEARTVLLEALELRQFIVAVLVALEGRS